MKKPLAYAKELQVKILPIVSHLLNDGVSLEELKLPVELKTIDIHKIATIPKSLISVEKLKRILTLVSKDAGFGNFSMELFKEYPSYVEVPRYYALKVFYNMPNVVFNNRTSGGFIFPSYEPFPAFVGDLRPVQKDVGPKALAQITKENNLGGILNLAVGTGKTVLAIWLISQLKTKTLVIVHKEFLVNQWIKRINEFMPSAKVGRIQQDVCDVDGKHIVIGMVHSLAMKNDYPKYIYEEFGTVVCDETHRMAAPMFSLALPKFNPRFRIGLSATVGRKDGMENAFIYHIGPIVAKMDVENLIPQIKRVFSTDVEFLPTTNVDAIPLGRIITIITKNRKRNALIASQITQAVIMNRKIIVMSDRLKHLDELKHLIEAILAAKGLKDKYSIGYYVGGMSETNLENSAGKDIILSTYKMAKEGLDIPNLDTIVLASPMSDVLQAIGRILRSCDDKKEPIVVDIVDKNVGLCMKMYYNRMRLYKTKGWK